MDNDDYPPNNFKGTGFWKYKKPKAETPPSGNDGKEKEEPEKLVPCVKRDGYKPWPMCE